MKKILTTDDKQYLRATSRYLQSLGQKQASLEFDSSADNIGNIDFGGISTFSSNYTIEIPTKVIAIFEKILNYIDENNLVSSVSDDYDVNYESIEFTIDTRGQELTLNHRYSYYEDGEEEGTEWELSDDENLKSIFDTLENDLGGKSQKVSKLRLDYNGSGDSGYIEDYFDNNSSVPADVENWCYQQLESQYGGWEINEGSRGYFIFDLENHQVNLTHIQINEQNDSEIIFEESFAK